MSSERPGVDASALTLLLVLTASVASAQEAGAPTAPPDPTEASTEPSAPEADPPEPAVQESSEYGAVIADALRDFGAGQFEAAADDFRRALALRPSARVYRGLGTALFELGDHVEASEALERALSHPVDPLDDTLRQEVLHLLRRVERHIATLVVSLDVAGAELYVAGARVQPGVLRVNGGSVVLEARARDHLPFQRTVRAVPGDSMRIDIELQPLTAPSITVVTPRRSRRLIFGIPSLVLGGAGVALGALWLTHHNDQLDVCPAVPDAVGCHNHERIQRRSRGAVAVIAAGGALVLVGAVLSALALAEDDEPQRQTTWWDCSIGEGFHCSLAGRF